MSITQSQDFFIQLHLTERCNLRCRHCYQTGKKTDEMSLSGIRDVVHESSDMLNAWSDAYGIRFSPAFNVTGGEPFLRKDLFGILEVIGAHGFDIYLLTNGVLINNERAKRLSELGIKGVQISMEGPEKTHDSIRGRGSFASSIKGVLYLVENGIKVTLNVTLSEINAGYFLDMVSLSASIGVYRLGFSRLVPSGRGAGLLNKMLMPDRLKDLYGSILSLNLNGLKIVTGDPVASQMSSTAPEDGGVFPTGGCAAGMSGLTILPDGTITPCRRLPIPIGNAKKDSLREVWATSEFLESLRDRSKYKGKCGTCQRWALCRGCRAIAYAFSQSKGKGDFLSEDPQCFIGQQSL